MPERRSNSLETLISVKRLWALLTIMVVLIGPQRPLYAQTTPSIGLLRDISTSPTIASSSHPDRFTEAADGAYFLDSGGSLWFTGGTRETTKKIPLQDLALGLTVKTPRAMTAWKNTLVFGATFEDPTGNASGCSSSSATRRSCTSQGLFVVNSSKSGVTLIRGKLYIEDSPEGRPNHATILTTSEYIIFFGEETHSSGTGYSHALWSSDGTRAGTSLIDPLDDGDLDIDERVVVGSEVFFHVSSGYTSFEGLWRTDGTKNGTFRWRTTEPLTLLSHQGNLYFVEYDYSGRYGPYSTYYLFGYAPSDPGAQVSRTQIGSFYASRSYPNLVASGGSIYFLTQGSRYSLQKVWKANQTTLTTTLVGEYEEPRYLTDFKDTLFFVTTDSGSGREVFKIGQNGVALASDIRSGLSGSNPHELTVAMGQLFFAADSGNEGVELWRIPSPTSSAILAQDIWPGLNSSIPSNLFGTKYFLLFGADNSQNGIEPWIATQFSLGYFPPDTPQTSPGQPGITASPVAVNGKWNRNNYLRYRVSGASSSRELISIYRQYQYYPVMSWFTSWGPVGTTGSSWSILFPAKRLRKGTYRWCVRPEDQNGNKGDSKCAVLKLR